MSKLAKLSNQLGGYLTDPRLNTADTNPSIPTAAQVKPIATEAARSPHVRSETRTDQNRRHALFPHFGTAFKHLDSAFGKLRPASWVAVKNATRRLFDNPRIAAYSNGDQIRLNKKNRLKKTALSSNSSVTEPQKRPVIFLPKSHINYSAPGFETVRPYSGPSLGALQSIARARNCSINEMHLVPNGFSLPMGEKMVCRHLIEQWIENEKLMASGPRCYAEVDSNKFSTLQNRYEQELMDETRTKQFVHHSRVGNWLEDLANALPPNCIDMPVRISNETHRMGLKISTGTLSDGSRSLTIKAYDPDAAKMITCGPVPITSVRNLSLKDVFPLYSSHRNPGGFVFSYAPGLMEKTPFHYRPSAVDLHSMSNAFALSNQMAGEKLFQELSEKLIEGPPVPARLIMENLIRPGTESPLITLADMGYNQGVFKKTLDIMKHAGLQGKEGEEYLAHVVSESSHIPLASFMFEKKDAKGLRDFLGGLSSLDIDAAGKFRLLNQADVNGGTPMHAFARNLTNEKAGIFFAWAKQNNLSKEQIAQLFLAQDHSGILPFQTALLGMHDSPNAPTTLLDEMKAFGFLSAEIHALISVPNMRGRSVGNALKSGQSFPSAYEINNWLKNNPV